MCASCGSLFYVLPAVLGLGFAVATEPTAHKRQCLPSQPLAVTRCDSVCWHLWFYIFLTLSRSRAAFPVCLHCCDVQVSWDGALYGKHITEGRTWPVWRSVLVKQELWMAPGIWSPQLPACIQLCFSYLIFYGTFVGVYRNNKAVFLRLYGISLELFQMCWFSFGELSLWKQQQVICLRIFLCSTPVCVFKWFLCGWNTEIPSLEHSHVRNTGSQALTEAFWRTQWQVLFFHGL